MSARTFVMFIGVLITVFGFAIFIAYRLAHFGLVAKIAGLAVAAVGLLTMIGAVVVEK